jgi:hypothetical protein
MQLIWKNSQGFNWTHFKKIDIVGGASNRHDGFSVSDYIFGEKFATTYRPLNQSLAK